MPDYGYGQYGSTQPVLPQFPNASGLPGGGGGGGINWQQLLMQWGPQILNLFGGLKGASDTDKANAANLAAVMARQQMVQGYVDPLLKQQQGQNPYSAALMQFIGRPGLGGMNGQPGGAPQGTPQTFAPWAQPAPGASQPGATHTTHDGQTVPIDQAHPAPNPFGIVWGNQDPRAQQGMDQRYFMPNPEGGNTAYNDYASYAAAGGQQPQFTPQQQASQATSPGLAQLVQQYSQQLGPNWYSQATYDPNRTSPEFPVGVGGLQFTQQQWDALPVNMRMNLQSAAAQGSALPGYDPNGMGGITGGGQYANSIGQMPGQGPVLTMPSGLPSDPTQPWTPTPTPTSNPLGPGTGTGTGTGQNPTFDPYSPIPGMPPIGGPDDPFGMSAGGMYRYQDPGENAFTYKPPKLGQGDAPTVTGLQGMNVGQDALMQMMRSSPSPGGDPGLSLNTQQLGEQFNNSDLFSALEPLDQRLIDKNVSQLRAGAGSLGQRFGTAMQQNEGQLREQLGQDVLSRNAQIASTSFEQGKQRELAGAGLRLNAAQGLTSAMGQSDALNQQAKLANQQMLGQFGLHGADIANQAGQFNAQQRMTQNQFTASQGNQFNNYIMQALMGGNNMQQGQFGNQASLISLLAGLPIGQQQPSAMPGAIQDSAMMWMLLPYLRNSQAPRA